MQTRSVNCMGRGTNSLGNGAEEKDLKTIMKHMQKESHHHNTANKIQTPSWRNVTHQMRSNPSVLLSTGMGPAPCPIWGAALALCEGKECRGEPSDTQRPRKHELWEQLQDMRLVGLLKRSLRSGTYVPSTTEKTLKKGRG